MPDSFQWPTSFGEALDNLDGSINTITYPSLKQVAYTVSNAQRLLTAKDPATGGAQYALTASYGAIGALQSVITGQISGGFGGITESHTYNNSLEYTSTQASSSAGTAMNLSLAYGLSGGDNGSVTGITNNQDTGRNQTFTYDFLNRVATAASQATSGADCWGQNFTPDVVANLNTVAASKCSPPAFSLMVDANNHVTGTSFAYDAMGNMTGDGQTGVTYTFDDEGRMVKATPSGGPWCYVYDGNGLRVAKIQGGTGSNCTNGTVTKLYWRSISGDSLAETDGTGSLTNTAYSEYVFFTGRRIASRVNVSSGTNPNVSIFYYFADQLGSTRTITTGSGKNADGTSQTPGLLCYDQDYTPYGQEIFTTGQMSRLQTAACPTNYKFTGYERDPETGLDYAFARYYSSRLARFLSTDPLGGHIGDLQSHNAYSYVINNPLNLADPSGMDFCDGNSPYGGWMPPISCFLGPPPLEPPIEVPGFILHVDVWDTFEDGPSSCPAGMDCGYGPWSSGSFINAGGGGGNSSGSVGGPAGPGTGPCNDFLYTLKSLGHIYDDHIAPGNEQNKSKYDVQDQNGFPNWYEKMAGVASLNDYVFANSGAPQVQYQSNGQVWSYVYTLNIKPGTLVPNTYGFGGRIIEVDRVGTLAGKLGGGSTNDATLVLDPDCFVRTSFPGKPLGTP